RFESSTGGGTLWTNELNWLTEIPKFRLTLLPEESKVPHQLRVGPPPPFTERTVALASESAVIRIPNADAVESRYAASAESSLMNTRSPTRPESANTAESPVVESTPPGSFRTLSTFTVRTSESVNRPVSAPNVAAESMLIRSRYRLIRRFVASVSRRTRRSVSVAE